MARVKMDLAHGQHFFWSCGNAQTQNVSKHMDQNVTDVAQFGWIKGMISGSLFFFLVVNKFIC